jgi:Putative prokaryotic signal transducing protein
MSKERTQDDIVRLATATNPLQAHIWEQALKEAGIPCRVVGDFLDAGVGDIPGVQAEVWVHRDDLARAEEVLRQGQEVSEAEPGDEAEA